MRSCRHASRRGTPGQARLSAPGATPPWPARRYTRPGPPGSGPTAPRRRRSRSGSRTPRAAWPAGCVSGSACVEHAPRPDAWASLTSPQACSARTRVRPRDVRSLGSLRAPSRLICTISERGPVRSSGIGSPHARLPACRHYIWFHCGGSSRPGSGSPLEADLKVHGRSLIVEIRGAHGRSGARGQVDAPPR